MKKLIIATLVLLTLLSCKKKVFDPEGPTDIRIRNKSVLVFQDVIMSTSEKTGDTATIGHINNGSVSDYFRYTKAYPKAEISAKINIGGSLIRFSTGPVNYTYMNYIGRDKVTYEVECNVNSRELTISNVILEEALVLK